ncbi:uncharacterized protein LOC121382637 [Gigantopelta aegis]|uniref:uncharacterized protein LOC121382637 n=1 Tax=Gigantopelta aegis TaxID=1735272 RepID=UPI001B88B8A0|nr:uncharacterized protein LOC121382637 [Gigantopelta aegis]
MSDHMTSDTDPASDTNSYGGEPFVFVPPKPNNMFSEPSATSDVVLLVEDKPIHVNKAVLSLASPVFAAVFGLDLKEKYAEEIPLPDKKYEYFIEFLLCLYPNTVKSVDRTNIDVVLPLAHEYQVESVKRRSEEMIVHSVKLNHKTLSAKELAHFLLISDKYSLKQSLWEVTKLAAKGPCTELILIEEFNELNSAVKFDVLEQRLESFEKSALTVLCQVKKLSDGAANVDQIHLTNCRVHSTRCQLCSCCERCVLIVSPSLDSILSSYKQEETVLKETLNYFSKSPQYSGGYF